MLNEIDNKTSPLEFSERAANDLNDAWTYLSERSLEAADNLIDELYEVCELIAINPLMGAARHEIIVDLSLFPHSQYNIYYFPTNGGVEIYRILHSSRDQVQVFNRAIDEV